MDHSIRVYDNILQTMPNADNPTPMVRINRINPSPDFQLYAKLEWFNPFGSVKDRAAYYLIRELEKKGALRAGRGIVEPTSGNTGISLAAMCSVLGYPMRAVVPKRIPLEKKVLLRIIGAELDMVSDDVCPSPGLGDGSINLAKSYARAQADRYAMPNQYENEENVRAHYETTGPEIWRQTGGKLTHLFLSLGTCGTVTGCGRFLRQRNPGVKIIAVQPSVGHDVPGLRNVSQLDVSKLFDPSLIDEIMEVDFELAYRRVLDLAQNEGLLAGPSSGLILEGAQRIIERERTGFGVMIFPDNVFKYVSSMIKHIQHLTDEISPS